MSVQKDDPEAIEFMARFAKLKDMIDDQPSGLEALAAGDESVRDACLDLILPTHLIEQAERRGRTAYARPVDPRFIAAWRDYEQRYADPIACVFLADLGLDLRETEPASRTKTVFQHRWKHADNDAAEAAAAIATALDFAEEQADPESGDYPDGFPEKVADGIRAWGQIAKETGFDVRGVMRRRSLLPFVLVPRHVSSGYGNAEQMSLFHLLQQAHDAFVFGVPFAAAALMRAITEVVLRSHYGSSGNDLCELIDNCRQLPKGVQRAALHRLRMFANAVLHCDQTKDAAPAASEQNMLSFLHVIRALIEGVPRWPAT